MTSRLTREQIAGRLRQAIEAAKGLTPNDIENVQELIEVGELLVAFETLCTQIYEWEIALSPEVIRDLEELGVSLGADPTLAGDLWEDATDS